MRAPWRARSKAESTGDIAMLGRVLAEARPFWGGLAALMALELLATPILLLTPLSLKLAVDSVIGSEPLPGFLADVVPDSITDSDVALLGLIAGMYVAVIVLSQLQDISTYVLRTKLGESMALGFRARLFAHLQRLSL